MVCVRRQHKAVRVTPPLEGQGGGQCKPYLLSLHDAHIDGGFCAYAHFAEDINGFGRGEALMVFEARSNEESTHIQCPRTDKVFGIALFVITDGTVCTARNNDEDHLAVFAIGYHVHAWLIVLFGDAQPPVQLMECIAVLGIVNEVDQVSERCYLLYAVLCF